MPIRTVAQLRTHLAWAIEMEHATIPPYLCALYSIKDQSSEAAETIRGIVIEEMLHLTLAGNLLNAVGGTPVLDHPRFIPRYPAPLPHHKPEPPLVIHLERCSRQTVENTFLRIEQSPSGEPGSTASADTSVGQLYDTIQLGLEILYAELGEERLFSGDPRRQLSAGYDASRHGGTLFKITNLHAARQAIMEIVAQGEGTRHIQYRSATTGEERLVHYWDHYWKLWQIAEGIVAVPEVWPMIPDPRTGELPHGPLRELARFFNGCYTLLLTTVTQAFATGDRFLILPKVSLPLMRSVLSPVAAVLVRQPIPGANQTAGASFEYRRVGWTGLVKECRALAKTYRELEEVCRALAGLERRFPGRRTAKGGGG